jgi:hypothetical protein
MPSASKPSVTMPRRTLAMGLTESSDGFLCFRLRLRPSPPSVFAFLVLLRSPSSTVCLLEDRDTNCVRADLKEAAKASFLVKNSCTRAKANEYSQHHMYASATCNYSSPLPSCEQQFAEAQIASEDSYMCFGSWLQDILEYGIYTIQWIDFLWSRHTAGLVATGQHREDVRLWLDLTIAAAKYLQRK